MRVAHVPAQAKINLILHVLSRNSATGYHYVSTIFQRIDLADDVVVRVGGSVRAIDCSGPRLPAEGLGPAEKNLAYRAALEYAERKGWPRGFSVELTKNIPVGGGLGGGSADAGAVLRALNALAPEPMNSGELWSVACSLGSDVPFLTKEWIRAVGSGRGEDLTDLSVPLANEADVLIAVPPLSIRTADAYRWLDDDREKVGWEGFPRVPIVPDLSHFGTGSKPASPWQGFARFEGIGNHFEPVVERRYPQIRLIRERLLEKGAELARLAGSGSCVFGIFTESSPTADDLALDALVIPTRTSARVVQVEVLE